MIIEKSAKERFIAAIKVLRAEYRIKAAPRSNEMTRRRIAVWVTDLLLRFTPQEIEALLPEIKLGSAAGHKGLSPPEKACCLAGIFECRLYQRLWERSFSCDAAERQLSRRKQIDAKLSVEDGAWQQGYSTLNLALLDDVINALTGRKEVAHGLQKSRDVVEKSDAGGERFTGFGHEKAVSGAFAGAGHAVYPAQQELPGLSR